jgi:hypothetical protein
MANRSKSDIEREIEECAVQVVQLQKDAFELEQQAEGSEPPADLAAQIQRKADELKGAEARHAALRAEAASAG